MAVVQCNNKHFYDNSKYRECPHCAAVKQTRMPSEANVLESQQVVNYASAYIRQNLARTKAADSEELMQKKPAENDPEAIVWQKQSVNDLEEVTQRMPAGSALLTPDDLEEVTQRMPASYNFAETVQKMPEAEMQEEASGRKSEALEETANIMTGNDKNQTGALYAAGWLVCIKGPDYGRNFPLYAGFNRIGSGGRNDIVLNDTQVLQEEHCSVVYEKKKNVFYLVPKKGKMTYLAEEMAESAQGIQSGQVVTLGETQLELVAFCIGEKRWVEK